MATLGLLRCNICHKAGGNHCQSCMVEPWPTETWSGFRNSDIVQLIVDACVELGRRDETLMVTVS